MFQTLRDLRGGVVKEVFGGHNPVNELPNWLGPDAAGILLRFFQQIDANTGDIRHDFTDPNWDTRFLGDLYQDLSEAARKKYALLQTPEFVEEFILDRTLDPALDEFTLTPSPNREGEAPAEPLKGNGSAGASPSRFKMIDPACGSGHFLLGTFPRILNRWQRQEPGTNIRELVQRTLDSIHGVDINPFAIAIAQFRLLLAAMRACGITRLIDAPAFRLNLVCGDSLLHAPLAAGGKKYTAGQQELDFALASDPADADECDHAYQSENLPELKRLLRGGQYHAVVANPPYIVPRDKQLNDRYRDRFSSCHRQYSLAIPFLQRIFQLANPEGYTGQITANSFMKREFGKKVIEEFLLSVDLTHVVDTSLAYIPGHGIPTVIMFGRSRSPVSGDVRVAMGIRREDEQPAVPEQGRVWQAILAGLDVVGFVSPFISVVNLSRAILGQHPWSLGGGGANELRAQIEESCEVKIKDRVDSIGYVCITKQDEVFPRPIGVLRRFSCEHDRIRPFGIGEEIRDWCHISSEEVIFPYDNNVDTVPAALMPNTIRHLWAFRCLLGDRKVFGGQTYFEAGKPWYEFGQIPRDRFKNVDAIVFPEVATHNHFVPDRTGTIFKHSAPAIKLKAGRGFEELIGLSGLLNSSVAGFWMKQVCHDKGGGGIGGGIAAESWERFFAFNGTRILEMPEPSGLPCEIAASIARLGSTLVSQSPAELIAVRPTSQSVRVELSRGRSRYFSVRGEMINGQEELDWSCYRLFGLIDEDLTSKTDLFDIQLGQRAFEIVLARKMAAGETQTTWFERHGSTPITELPAEWPDDYRQLVERRIALIASDPNIRLIEQPEYKRRWNTEPWDSQLERALREWLLDRLESYFDFDGRMKESVQCSVDSVQEESQNPQTEHRTLKTENPPALAAIQLYSIAKLADVASKDADFMQVAELYRDDPAFNVLALVEELVNAETVPLLQVLRYKDTGLRKRAEWEKTWELQRREDAASDQLAVVSRQLEQASAPEERHRLQAEHEKLKTENSKLTASIAVPPKYDSKDFLNAHFWRLRGKLDVPKERWISFPGAEAEDGSLMICWAGYDQLQQAQAISAWYVEIRDQQGGHNDKRLIPLLACLLELLPWIKQWHNSSDNEFNMAMGDFFEGFIKEESRQLPRPAVEPAEPDGEDLFPDAAAAITYGWSLPEIQAWKPSARRPAKRAAKKAAKKASAPKKAAKKRGKKTEKDE